MLQQKNTLKTKAYTNDNQQTNNEKAQQNGNADNENQTNNQTNGTGNGNAQNQGQNQNNAGAAQQ